MELPFVVLSAHGFVKDKAALYHLAGFYVECRLNSQLEVVVCSLCVSKKI